MATFQGRTYTVAILKGTDGYAYAGPPTSGSEVTMFDQMLSDVLADLAAATTIGGVAPGAAGAVLYSNGSAWVRSATPVVTSLVITSGQKLWLDGPGSGGAGGDTYWIETSANQADLFVGGANTLTVTATAVAPISGTTGSAANVFQSASGNALLRSTSSLRYKDWIGPMSADRARAIVLALNEDGVEGRGAGFYRSLADADDPKRVFFGFTAERGAEVDDALVNYSKEGHPDGFAYDRMTVPHNVMLADLERRVSLLEAGVRS